MLDQYHTTSIGPDEEALRAAFLKCGDLMKARGCTVMGLPVLIPQVYLNYDPYTRQERGDERVLARKRMDFLLMLVQVVRIVLEVDGRHHYAVQDSADRDLYIANAKRYAEMSMEDRRLKLAGYEVYRFGGQEFMDVDLLSWTVGPDAQQVAAAFFDRLLKKHGVL